MKKRILTALLAVMMMFSVATITASAADPTVTVGLWTRPALGWDTSLGDIDGGKLAGDQVTIKGEGTYTVKLDLVKGLETAAPSIRTLQLRDVKRTKDQAAAWAGWEVQATKLIINGTLNCSLVNEAADPISNYEGDVWSWNIINFWDKHVLTNVEKGDQTIFILNGSEKVTVETIELEFKVINTNAAGGAEATPAATTAAPAATTAAPAATTAAPAATTAAPAATEAVAEDISDIETVEGTNVETEGGLAVGISAELDDSAAALVTTTVVDDGNPKNGVVLAIIPALVAGAAVVIARKRK